MSYILDALKKSEAERNRGVAPSLLDARHLHAGSRAGLWVLLAALIVNVGLGGFWFLSRGDVAAEPERNAAAAAPPQPDATVGDPTTVVPDQTPPVAQLSSTATAISVAAPPTIPDAAPAVPAPKGNEMELANLTFSTHVYASDPTKRAVTLNGRRLIEGDTISPGVQLRQITETGVVLDVNGRDVPLEVLQDWR